MDAEILPQHLGFYLVAILELLGFDRLFHDQTSPGCGKVRQGRGWKISMSVYRLASLKSQPDSGPRSALRIQIQNQCPSRPRPMPLTIPLPGPTPVETLMWITRQGEIL